MNRKTLKYFLDILSIIDELEMLLIKVNHNFELFRGDFMATRTAERNLEIIGEAFE